MTGAASTKATQASATANAAARVAGTAAGTAPLAATAVAAAARLVRMRGFNRDWMFSTHCHVGYSPLMLCSLARSVGMSWVCKIVALATDVGRRERSFFCRRRGCGRGIRRSRPSLLEYQFRMHDKQLQAGEA